MERVAVVGTSGSGKSTLAAALARRLGGAHVELDALHWEPGWTEAAPEVLRARVDRALAPAPARWVCDGNYGRVRDIVWGRADTVVWLDYPLHVVLARVTWRTARRLARREVMWNGNRESLRAAFSRDSIVWWALTTWGANRRTYLELVARPEHARLRVVRLRSPREAEAWLRGVPSAR